ncbi:MAG TPA: response regulator transcription factor [Candidatus Eisenbacteria bacterium]
MAKTRILIAEDDPKTVASVRLYLEHAGFEVLAAPDGRRALALARAAPPPDLVVLDIMLPHVDGLAVCRALRTESAIPIILLTARATEEDRLEGLDLGADDYVTKPFSPRELTARVRAVLRRAPGGSDASPPGPPIRLRGFSLDPARREVRVRGKRVELTPREFRLLETMARSPGRAFTREELVARAFGLDYEGLDRTIDAHVVNLRRKIEAGPTAPRWIETVFGVGYRFVAGRSDA